MVLTKFIVFLMAELVEVGPPWGVSLITQVIGQNYASKDGKLRTLKEYPSSETARTHAVYGSVDMI